MSLLLSPITQRSITFRNRIAVSPMCMYSCTDGIATDFHLVHAGARALGGAALFIQEASSVSPEGRISPHDLGIWSDAHISPLARITAFLSAHGCVPGIQLAHAGWKAGSRRPWEPKGPAYTDEQGGWQPIAPSVMTFSENSRTPREIINPQDITAAFTAAATRALTAGYQLIELHAAHGYLLHTFLSPLSNKRTDTYGGSFENRTRLLRETVSAVREVWPDHLPLWVRLSATDYVEGSWSLNDSVELAKQLKPLGVDTIDCSSGGFHTTTPIPTSPGYQVPFAEKIRAQAQIPTAAVGLITTPQQAEQILQNHQADFILLARESLRNPNFPLLAAKELNAPLPVPPQYQRAYP